VNVVVSLWRGAPAGDNPWNALTPEWLTSSPPPVENWLGEAPLVKEPYGYGIDPARLRVDSTSGLDVWLGGNR
jgi:cytochrome c oxidase subunit 1